MQMTGSNNEAQTSTTLRRWPHWCVCASLLCLLVIVTGTVAGQAPSVRPGDVLNPELDPVLKSIDGLTIHDRLGEKLPLDKVIRTESGEQVALGNLFQSKRPVILNPVYFSCPMLCNLVVEGLIESVASCGLKIGEDFEVLTLSIDPRDSAGDARNRENLLVKALEDAALLAGSDVSQARQGWHFVTGKKTELKAIADSVGFDYRWNDYNAEYAHGAGIFIVSPEGVLTQTVKGFSFEPQTLRLALVEASDGKIGSWLDDIVLTCFVYDPSKAQYGPAALKVMRLGGIIAVLGIGGFLFQLWRRDRQNGDSLVAADSQREQSQS